MSLSLWSSCCRSKSVFGAILFWRQQGADTSNPLFPILLFPYSTAALVRSAVSVQLKRSSPRNEPRVLFRCSLLGNQPCFVDPLLRSPNSTIFRSPPTLYSEINHLFQINQPFSLCFVGRAIVTRQVRGFRLGEERRRGSGRRSDGESLRVRSPKYRRQALTTSRDSEPFFFMFLGFFERSELLIFTVT